MPRLTLLPLPGHPAHAAAGARALVIEVPTGTSVLDAAALHGFLIATRCGGITDCRTCRVEVAAGQEAALSAVEADEREALDEAGAEPQVRLACQARVLGDVEVRVPDPSAMEWT